MHKADGLSTFSLQVSARRAAAGVMCSGVVALAGCAAGGPGTAGGPGAAAPAAAAAAPAATAEGGGAAGGSAAAHGALGGIDLASARVVDLSHPITPEMPLFPGSKPYATQTLGTVEKDGYYINRFSMDEHAGTHVDAPAHFKTGTATVEQIAPEHLVGAAAVVDVTAKVAASPDHQLTVEDLRGWEARHGALGPRHIVLVRTGWAARWGEPARYQNQDAKGVMHFPGVSVEASRYLHERGVRGIGIDTLSTDPGPSQTFEQHKTFLGAGGYHIENLANLDQLPETGAVVMVAPLPLARGSGAPARVLALVPAGGEGGAR
ncbi:cyclase family protein [Sorangium sp. So ce131]|uniref:cyclase family protein n=1 Tax=Sorangium sp. So ce131 TaxID=3133282 RepID=UPI003F5FB65B